MAIIKRKTTFVLFEVWHFFSTSRRSQWMAILGVAVAIVVGSCIWKYQTWRATQMSQIAQRQLLSASLLHLPGGSGAATVALGIDTENLPPALRNSFSDCIKKELTTAFPATDFASDVLLPDFYNQGYFSKAFAGDTAFLNDVGFFKGAGTLLLVKPEVSFKDSSLGGGMKTCIVDLAFRSYSSSQISPRRTSIHLVGNGFSEEASMRDALARLSQSEKVELSSVLGDKS